MPLLFLCLYVLILTSSLRLSSHYLSVSLLFYLVSSRSIYVSISLSNALFLALALFLCVLLCKLELCLLLFLFHPPPPPPPPPFSTTPPSLCRSSIPPRKAKMFSHLCLNVKDSLWCKVSLPQFSLFFIPRSSLINQ